MINITQEPDRRQIEPEPLEYPKRSSKNKTKLIRKEFPKIREMEREKQGETYTFYRVDCRGIRLCSPPTMRLRHFAYIDIVNGS